MFASVTLHVPSAAAVSPGSPYDPRHHRHRIAHSHLPTGYMQRDDAEYPLLLVPQLFASSCGPGARGGSRDVVGWEVSPLSYLYRFRSAISPPPTPGRRLRRERIGASVSARMLLYLRDVRTLDFQRCGCRRRARDEWGKAGRHDYGALLFSWGHVKSAQIPLYVWLPAAMEGPTPVSALIHAATMVTAGVYMIGRNAVLFSHAPTTLAVVAGIGAATALMAGTIGLVQNDIKRVLAYSTVSQLGYMFLAMGVGAYAAGIFHLYTPAFSSRSVLGRAPSSISLAGEQTFQYGRVKNYRHPY